MSPPRPQQERGLNRARVVLLALGLVVGLAAPVAWVVATRGADAESPAPVAVAHVVERSGRVTVQRGASTLEAVPGTPLVVADVVSTGPDGTALLRFTDGQELLLSPGTRFRLEGSPGALRLVLEQGAVRSRGPRGPHAGPPLTLVLPRGSARLVQGAEVSFTLGPEGGAVRVLQGELLLLELGGGERKLVAGEALELALDDPAPVDGKRPSTREEGAALELLLSAKEGTPLVRARGAERFVPASRTPAPVAEGTAVRVPPRAHAQLASRSLRVGLQGGSEAEVGAAQATPAGETYALAVEAGGAALDLTGEGRRTLTLSGRGRRLDVEVEGAASAALAQGRDATRLTVRVGQARVSAGGVTHTVQPGEVAELTDAGLTVRSLPRPTLLLPARGPLRVHANRLGDVALALGARDAAGPPGPVLVEVATDAAFSERVLTGRTERDFVTVPAPASGELHWRALGRDGALRAQGHARFLPDRDAGRDATHPHAEIAQTGLKATIYFQGPLPSLGLRWPAHAGAQRYRVRVYREDALSTPLLERTTDGPRVRLAAGAVGEGRYLWHAAPLDARGVELAGGRMSRLELVFDNANRTLVLSRTGGPGAPVRGVAPLGSQLFLNDTPVALDAKGRFRTRAPASGALVFRLVSTDGSESFWVRPLAAPRPRP